MAKEQPTKKDQTAKPAEPSKGVPAQKGYNLKKLIIFGISVFILQVVVVYFLTSRFVAPGTGAKSASDITESREERIEPTGQYVFVVKDLIINPAGTNGSRFLLTTIGFEVSSLPALQEIEKKEVQVRDMLNTILTAKKLDDLAEIDRRETLRGEIFMKSSSLVRAGKLTNVYFSKFILQ